MKALFSFGNFTIRFVQKHQLFFVWLYHEYSDVTTSVQNQNSTSFLHQKFEKELPDPKCNEWIWIVKYQGKPQKTFETTERHEMPFVDLHVLYFLQVQLWPVTNSVFVKQIGDERNWTCFLVLWHGSDSPERSMQLDLVFVAFVDQWLCRFLCLNRVGTFQRLDISISKSLWYFAISLNKTLRRLIRWVISCDLIICINVSWPSPSQKNSSFPETESINRTLFS